MNVRVGLGFDVHPFGGDGPLVLGGVTVEGPGLVGHSDADVAAHAVADALLGAAGLPDLGAQFPATDESLGGISSLELLRRVAIQVAAQGWGLGNVDVVIAAEQPSLAPHLVTMGANLAASLSLLAVGGDAVAVTVKAKRGEGVGVVGRGEAIAAWAVALLVRMPGEQGE